MLQSCDIFERILLGNSSQYMLLVWQSSKLQGPNVLVGVLYWCVCCDAFEWHIVGVIVIHPDNIIHRTALNIYSMWENIAIMLFCV